MKSVGDATTQLHLITFVTFKITVPSSHTTGKFWKTTVVPTYTNTIPDWLFLGFEKFNMFENQFNVDVNSAETHLYLNALC